MSFNWHEKFSNHDATFYQQDHIKNNKILRCSTPVDNIDIDHPIQMQNISCLSSVHRPYFLESGK